jgi:hypothetical protein
MDFSTLPIHIKKEFLSIKDMSKNIDDTMKKIIDKKKTFLFFRFKDDNTTEVYYYHNNKWHEAKQRESDSFTYDKFDDNKYVSEICLSDYNHRIVPSQLKGDRSIFLVKNPDDNEYYLIVDDYDFEIDIKNNTFKTKQNPKFYLVNEENKSDISLYLSQIQNLEILEDELKTNKLSLYKNEKRLILFLYLELKRNPEIMKSIINYKLINLINSGTDLKTACSFFNKDGKLKIHEWLLDLNCDSITKINKYKAWVKQYNLDKNNLLEIDNFFSTIKDQHINKINSILSKKDSENKNFYSLEEIINYIKEQVLNNSLYCENVIGLFHTMVNLQIKKFGTIKERFPENLNFYINYLYRILPNNKMDSNEPEFLYEKNDFKLYDITETSQYLLLISEKIKQDLWYYSSAFNKNIYIVTNNNIIVKIFDLTIDKKRVDRIFYDNTDENVDNFINEAFTMNLFQN